MIKPQLNKINNQLSVLTVNMPAVKSATALVLVGTGSRYEEKKLNGIAHFAEHMFFKGTEKRPEAVDISSTIDGVGGEFNAFTSKEYTGYYVKAASKHLDLSLDVVSDMLLNSKFEQKEIDKERGVVGEELRMYLDQPMRYVGEIYEMLLYGDQPLGWDTVGTLDSLANINRADFVNYIENYYKPNNMLLVISGDVTEEKGEDLAKKYFGSLSDKETKTYLPVKISQTEPDLRLFTKETEQAHLVLGVRGFPIGNPDHYKMSVLNAVLGTSMSSRLFLEVREKRGLAYYVRSGAEEYLDAGSFSVSAGVEPGKIEEAIKVIMEQLARVTTEDVPQEEFNKAKENIKGKLVLELEDSRDVAVMFGLQQLLEKRLRTVETIMTEIDKVSAKDIKDLATRIFKNDALNLAVIGPYKDESKFTKILKW
jgi:predicted Zn-dependent peptidase